MDFVLGAGAAVLGTVLASFINAVSFRWGTGLSIAAGRSRCMHCGHTLSAADLVPVLSYIFLRGRCRYCGSRISPQYPLVELCGGVLSLGTYWLHPMPAEYAFWLAIWMLLLFAAVYDLRHTIIPWSISSVVAILALGHAYLIGAPLYDIAAGPLLALPLFLLWLVSGGRWMGLGDSVLELGLGWLLGLTLGLTGFFLAFWSGAIVGTALLVCGRSLPAGRQVTMKSEVPFAPFLIAGALAAHFLHVDFFSTLPALFF
ncbi:MAG: prepilin peptidase [Patescibacteria group bacterium]